MGHLSSFLIRDNGYKRAGAKPVGHTHRSLHQTCFAFGFSLFLGLRLPPPWALSLWARCERDYDVGNFPMTICLVPKRAVSPLLFTPSFRSKSLHGSTFAAVGISSPRTPSHGLWEYFVQASSRNHFQMTKIVYSSSKDTFCKTLDLPCTIF